MIARYVEPSITTSIRITSAMHEQMRENHIAIVDALRTGVSILLAEKGVVAYDNNLNIMRRVEKLTAKLSETTQELEALKEKVHATTDT